MSKLPGSSNIELENSPAETGKTRTLVAERKEGPAVLFDLLTHKVFIAVLVGAIIFWSFVGDPSVIFGP
jgi:hypothetical protein